MEWWALLISGLCAFGAAGVALGHIAKHLMNYTAPLYQRHIVRIIFMVPVFAVASWLSLLTPSASIYFDAVTGCYEAFIIYNFLALLLAYVGGPGAVDVKMNGHVLAPSLAHCTCCLPPLPVNGMFVKASKRMTLQFVLLKPLLATLTIVLHVTGHYAEGDWSPGNGYLWVTLLYNATYSVALYGLVLFYQGCRSLLAPYKPLLKFAMVKLIVFVTFWQGLFISILVALDVLPSTETGSNLQSFLICVEMLPAALCMMLAFPWNTYRVEGAAARLKNVADAISLRDVVSDTVHHFAPAYQDYVLYSDGTAAAKGPEAGGGDSQTPSPRGAASKGKARAVDRKGLLANMDAGGSGWRTTEEGVVADPATAGHPSMQAPSIQMADLEGGGGGSPGGNVAAAAGLDTAGSEGQPADGGAAGAKAWKAIDLNQ